MKNTALAILLIGYTGLAQAVDLSETTTAGSSLLTQSIGADGEAGGDKDKDIDAPWTWNVEYDYTRSKSSNPGGGDIIDNTNDYSMGGAWKGISGFGLDLALQYSNTPSENLVSRGGTLTPSYRWEYRPPPADADDFSPYFEAKLDTGSTNYLESFTGSVQRRKNVVRPVSGTAELRQSLFGIDLSWRPVHDWRFGLSADHYGYNRDVVQFQNALDSPAALARGVNGFSNTVGGLPRLTYGATITWYFAPHWKNTLVELYSVAAADASISTISKDSFEYHLGEQWRITAGAKWEKSSTLSDVLGILGLEWDLE